MVREIPHRLRLLVVLALLGLMHAGAVRASILHVNSSDPTCGGSAPCYSTIQAAVDAASTGDTVRVQPGSYPEWVRVTGKSDLTLEGDPASAPGSSVVATPLTGFVECMSGTAAIEVASSSDVTIRRLAVSGYDGSGVRLRGAAEGNTGVSIVGMRIVGNGRPECGAGILIEEPNPGTLLAHNVVYGNVHDGVVLQGLPPLATVVPQYLWSNTIYGNGNHGVVVSGFEQPFLWNNLIAGNGAQPSPSLLLPAYGIVRDLTGVVAPLTGSEMVLQNNLVCGNRSGEVLLAPTESAQATGNQSPTGLEGAGFSASPECDDPAVLFGNGAGADATWGTLDDDHLPSASSPAIDRGDAIPVSPTLDAATLEGDFAAAGARPADGNGDGVPAFDIGALEYEGVTGTPPAGSLHFVNGSDPTCGGSSPCYGTIQAAIDASGPGDTVRVQSGSYPELVRVVGKGSLTVEGDPASPPGSAVVAPPLTGFVDCTVGTAAVEVASSSGVTLRRLAVSGYDGSGVRLRGGIEGSSGVAIVGMRIVGNGRPECAAGILVEEPNPGTLVAHNVIHANVHHGIEFQGVASQTTADPQYLWSNTIYGNGAHGVSVSGVQQPFLWNNLIAGNGAQPSPSNLSPAYGVARDLTGVAAPLSGAEMMLRHNLLCGNRSGEVELAPTEVAQASGNQTPTGSEGTGFSASANCDDPAVLFGNGAGADSTWGTLDDDFFLAASSPGIEAGDSPPAMPALDLPTLRADFRVAAVRPADGDDDGGFEYDIGALEWGVAPSVSITDPADASIAASSQPAVSGTFQGTKPLAVEVQGSLATLSGQTFTGSASLVLGSNVLTATGSNAFGSGSHSVTVTLPPLDVAIGSPASGTTTDATSITVSGSVNDSAPGAVGVEVNGIAASMSGSSFDATVPLSVLTNVVTATATRVAESASDQITVVRATEPLPPPAPTAGDEASDPDPGVAVNMVDSVSFLYEGEDPIQTMPDTAVIDELRAAVVRGNVLTRSGDPVGGVTVSVLDRPEFGHTVSQVDGSYDLVVNGGGAVTLDYRRSGFVPVQRRVRVPWRDYVIVDDIVMIPYDSVATVIALPASGMQVAQSSVSSDADGMRQATLLVPSGTTASMSPVGPGVDPNLTTMTVRLTEFTVSDTGVNAMPGSLPPTSAYTYAVEMSADEAVASGAKTVTFNQPLSLYIDNFLGFDVGTIIPMGTYDYDLARWDAEPNGKVIRIDSVDGGGMAVVTPSLGLSADERTELANLFQVGDELWRIPVAHFTPGDANAPPLFPPDAKRPPFGSLPPNETGGCPSTRDGSIIECETQVLGETIALADVPYALHYRSSRTPGHAASRTIRIPIVPEDPDDIPSTLNEVKVTVDVAGRRSRFTFPPTPGQPLFPFTWDGLDAYGRLVNGSIPGTVTIGWVYDAYYGEPAQGSESFGQPTENPNSSTAIGFSRESLTAIRQYQTRFGPVDARSWGVGGWTLSPHHFYDPDAGVLYRGDGGRRSASGSAEVIRHLGGGDRTYPYTGIPGPATGARFSFHAGFGGTDAGMTVGPDGSIYIASPAPGIIPGTSQLNPDQTGMVARIDPSGWTEFVTKPYVGPEGDSDDATTVAVKGARGVAVGSDGSIYIGAKNSIRKVLPTGEITTIAGVLSGSGVSGCNGDNDGQAALGAVICPNDTELEVGPDGSVYFAEVSRRIRRVRPDGILETVVGVEASNTQGYGTGTPGEPARNWAAAVRAFTFDEEGRLYFASGGLSGQNWGVDWTRFSGHLIPEHNVLRRGGPPWVRNAGSSVPSSSVTRCG